MDFGLLSACLLYDLNPPAMQRRRIFHDCIADTCPWTFRIEGIYAIVTGMSKAALLKKFLRFLFVGGLATGLQYAMLVTLVSLWQWQVTLASMTGFVASAIVNYWLNYKLTFRAKNSHRTAASRFSATAGMGLLLNGFIVHVGTTYTPFPYLWSQIVATVVVLFWNFVGSLKWSYASPARKSP